MSVDFPPKIIVFEDDPERGTTAHVNIARELGFQVMATSVVEVAGSHLTDDVRGIIAPLLPHKESKLNAKAYGHNEFLERARELEIARALLMNGSVDRSMRFGSHDTLISLDDLAPNAVKRWLGYLPLSIAEKYRQEIPDLQRVHNLRASNPRRLRSVS